RPAIIHVHFAFRISFGFRSSDFGFSLVNSSLMIRLVQLQHPRLGRRTALVEEPRLRFLQKTESIFHLAQSAIAAGQPLEQMARAQLVDETIEYDLVHAGNSDWRLLPPFDHPDEPSRCLVSGTGLTHRRSAQSRQAMHTGQQPAPVSDTMRMYQSG